VITQFATAKAGLVLVNINPAYRLTEVEYALNKVGCKALITADHFKTSDYVGMLRELAPELDRSVPGHLSAARLPLLAAVIRIGADERPGMFRFADIMAAGGERHAGRLGELATRLQFDDPINIQFTSGTTGAPKGATLTHHHAIGSQSQYRSITASAWCWAISPASPMARRWSIQVRASSPWPSSRPSKPSAVRRCTACRRCSLPSSATPNSSAST
jgi:acyl-CoA synthetase (AMP-forming)/AMP-acid ligase II